MRPYGFIFFVFILTVRSSIANNSKKSEHYGLLEDGTYGERRFIADIYPFEKYSGNSTTENPEPTCDVDEYLASDGLCYQCLLHNAVCQGSSQCCSTPNMACWKYMNYDPMCKCNPGYAWDEQAGVCYVAPVPPFYYIMGFTALAAICVVAISAFFVFLCSFCNKRYGRYGSSRPQLRTRHQRRNAQRQPAPRRHRLSLIIPKPPADPLPDKPPNYEDVYGLPTVSQALSRRANGSIRSLPPAYTPNSGGVEASPESIVIEVVQDARTSENEIQQNSPITLTQEDYNDEAGVSNPAFNREYHI